MTNVTMVKGLNAEQYEAIKKAAKAELPFTVNIRICRRNYAYGAIDVRPKSPRGNNDPFYKWTEEEFKLVLEFVLRHGLVYTAGGFIEDVQGKDGFDKFQMQYIIHGKGFNFLRMVDAPQPKVEKVQPVVETIEITAYEERTAIEEIIDDVIEYSTTLMTDYQTASVKRPETAEEKQVFAANLGQCIQENAYDLVTLLTYIKTNYSTYRLLIEALETVQVSFNNKNNEVTYIDIEESKEIITQINSNGSKSAGQEPDTVDVLLDVLSKYPLDPTFENYGNFVSEYKPNKVLDSNKHLLGCTSFFGNFLNYSHVFNIITNDNEIISKLTEAIQKNKNRDDYKEARTELHIEKRMKEIADQKFYAKEIDLQSKYQLSSKYTDTGKVLYEHLKNELFAQQHETKVEITSEELEQIILKTPSKYEPVPFQVDWGTSTRGQGKRFGKMVMGAMEDAPRGVKTYYNKYGNLPDYELIKDDVRSLNHFEEFRYMKARDYGLNHEESYVFCFGMDHLQKYWERKKAGLNTAV